MKKIILHSLLAIVFAGVLVACSDSNVSENEPCTVNCDVEPLLDMVSVSSMGDSVVLGSNAESAKVEEQPEMKIAFDYDFYIGKHEVTCKDFLFLMRNLKGGVDCSDDEDPVSNVTYYDAILFANAKSKMEGLDTVYSYLGASYNSKGNCVGLTGLEFKPSIRAYRLPTEAEWVYVASKNLNSENAWLAENSSAQKHAICTEKNSADICDMAGNVMEWVNDWLGLFRDTVIVDYVGAPNGGSLGKRIVKGGCYNRSIDALKIYSRGDVYTVTSSTMADYVGFRLAYGEIPNAVWMDDDGTQRNSVISQLASADDVQSFFGSYHAKIVFRNDLTGNLVFKDYFDDNQGFTEIKDTIDSYHPEISPDGKYVAFCTGIEGISGTSSVYVRELDENGSNLVELENVNAAIPRWKVTLDGDTVIVFVSDAGVNTNSETFFGQSTWQVKFSNGKFGVPEKLFDGAYHSGVSSDNRLAISGARLLRARMQMTNADSLAKDSIWYNGEQACNASLANDGSKRTLFLDFGGKSGQNFTKKDYGVHEMLLVADSNGSLINGIPAPSNYSFDHSEWVLGNVGQEGGAAVAMLANMNGAHQKVVGIGMKTGNVLELAKGEELWHPSLWIDYASAIENSDRIDSMGVYLTNNSTDRAKILRCRMELYWKYRDSLEVALLGASRTSNGVDPYYLTSYRAVNLGYFYSNFFDIVNFYNRYIRQSCPKLKYVVVSLDIDYFNHLENSNFFATEYKDYPGYVFDENRDFGRKMSAKTFYDVTHDGLTSSLYQEKFTSLRSSLFAQSTGWGGNNPEIDGDSTWMTTQKEAYDATMIALSNFLKETQEDGVYVVGIIFPMSPGYKNTGAYGKYGLSRSASIGVIESLDSLDSAYPHFILMDENKMGNHDYTDDMAQDADHLNPSGAKQLTERLDSLLRAWPF